MSDISDWNQLEQRVRQLASYKWNCSANPEEVAGVRIDCVLKPDPDRWVCIEVTVEKSLEKLRTDLAKFASIRPALIARNIYCKCFFVTKSTPTESIRKTAEEQCVQAMSVVDFEALFIDYNRYVETRLGKTFGSAIDPITGAKDQKNYVPVKYLGVHDSKDYSIDDIALFLEKGDAIVLLGNFGTGKSRCVQEVFKTVAANHGAGSLSYPLALNLREHWGNLRAAEIVRRHFDDLGLSSDADAIIRVLGKQRVLMLLDGFDELGAQSWSDDPLKLSDIRHKALSGVRDLVGQLNGGILITGREHYFTSDKELMDALGLAQGKLRIMKCADEFSESEMQQYLNIVSPGSQLPTWLPKRPLICQIIGALSPSEVKRLVESDSGEYEFWGALFDAVCEREAKINVALVKESIRRVLMQIARRTRTKPGNIGPITLSEISKAFEAVAGRTPTEESVTMLNRLPSLGRISSESSDRQFIDTYFLDGLRAEDLRSAAYEQEESILTERWINPLERLGVSILARDMAIPESRNIFFKYMKMLAKRGNVQAAADIASALMALDDSIDFEGIHLARCRIPFLNMSGGMVTNMKISECEIGSLTLSSIEPSHVEISDCIIDHALGVSAQHGLPAWIKNCDVLAYESVSTISRIKQAQLSPAQMVFVGIIKKTFFQPGSGRKEEALFRGFGSIASAKVVHKIVSRLITENILTKRPGRDGPVYLPVRHQTRRMESILNKLTLCDDPLWLEVSRMN